jgi:hypothetical protein
MKKLSLPRDNPQNKVRKGISEIFSSPTLSLNCNYYIGLANVFKM